jgi:hypothetical protein
VVENNMLSKKEDEVQLILRALRKQGKKAAASRQSAMDFLIRAGIFDKKGKLAKPYRSSVPI